MNVFMDLNSDILLYTLEMMPFAVTLTRIQNAKYSILVNVGKQQFA